MDKLYSIKVDKEVYFKLNELKLKSQMKDNKLKSVNLVIKRALGLI